MLIGLVFLRWRKKARNACRLCVGVEQLDSGLDGLSCLIGSALVFRYYLSGQVERKVRELGKWECVRQMRQIRLF